MTLENLNEQMNLHIIVSILFHFLPLIASKVMEARFFLCPSEIYKLPNGAVVKAMQFG